MAKKIFKVGDRVFDIICGWGEIESIDSTRAYPITAVFDGSKTNYTYKGELPLGKIRTLSFTEYGFDNRFTQERPINYEEYIGKWGKFWDNNPQYFRVGKLDGYVSAEEKPFFSRYKDFKNFEPLTDEQVKILELE